MPSKTMKSNKLIKHLMEIREKFVKQCEFHKHIINSEKDKQES